MSLHPEDKAQLIQLLNDTTCLKCGKQMYWDDSDTGEGSVYSDAGLKETRISGFCEHCFDEVTHPPDEPEDDRDWKDYYEQSIIDEEYAKDRFSDLIEDREPDEHSDEL
uniref:Uncharacterized protein n=1 Tax=Microbacterium phage RicoCaldo TaxID=3230836 RepID=A0AAU8EFS1_9CAUD